MSRLGREKREQQGAAHPAVLAAAPVDVLVGPDGASVGGVPVPVTPGEEIQQTVLNHLHRVALATGHPVHATVRDDRIGYVVALRVAMDGASSFTAEPRPTTPPEPPALLRPEPPAPARPELPAAEPQAPADRLPEPSVTWPPAATDDPPPARSEGHDAGPAAPEDRPAAPAEPARPAEPATFPLRAVPEDAAEEEPRDAVPTFRLRAVPEWVENRAPGTVAPPTGQFGPPPVMGDPATAQAPAPQDAPQDAPRGAARTFGLIADAHATDVRLDDPDPRPTPPRGFDAVAEAVLGDDPATAYDGGGTPLLAEPMAGINEAVKAGRIQQASELAEETVVRASAALGAKHPEVLRLLELTSYIAYLAGDPVRAFGLSLDLARTRHGARDAEAAYGNVQSAATAWRAVRDPELGLRMGVDLLNLWTELSAEGGPAAEDAEQLDSARARMGRLAERARKS